MKLLIEIPDITYKRTLEIGALQICKDEDIYHWIANGTPIPNNPTNGNVIEAMFPQYTPRQCGFSIWLVDDTKGIEHAMDNARFDVDFWNASYKADKEKEK